MINSKENSEEAFQGTCLKMNWQFHRNLSFNLLMELQEMRENWKYGV